MSLNFHSVVAAEKQERGAVVAHMAQWLLVELVSSTS